ncbi:MAG: geranylgeranyl reductase family protein [Nitrospinae bacterium]|nr:geranylgeranyl reductase family protein [Nitrospinota bacterium]
MDMPTTLYDVIVVGAGPAGSTAARCCSEKGIKTLLIDKADFPRYKPCGGSLSLRTMSCLDFELPPDLIEAECTGVKVYYKDKSAAYKKPDRIAVMVSRKKFDNLLYERARDSGCMTLTGERVVSIENKRDYIMVNTEKGTYTGMFVIGADGANSVVSRFLNGGNRGYLFASAFVSEIPLLPSLEKDVLHFYFDDACSGYAWIFPHGAYLSAGIWGTNWNNSSPLDSLKGFLKSHNLPFDKIRGHKMPLWDRKRKICSDKILLTGDAAGFIDSFSGEGIYTAILSGKIAAESVSDCIINKAAVCDYEKRRYAVFGNNLRYALCFSRMVHKFPRIFLDKFASDNSLLKRYIDNHASNTSYSDYIRSLISLKAKVKFGKSA